MANNNPSFESSRQKALMDKQSVRKKYCPPPICDMKYWIEDKLGHCKFFFLTKAKYLKCLKKLSKAKDFRERYKTCLD